MNFQNKSNIFLELLSFFKLSFFFIFFLGGGGKIPAVLFEYFGTAIKKKLF